MTALPSAIDFFAEKDAPPEDGIIRDHLGRALILPPPGYAGDDVRRKDGRIPYSRASSFGKGIEDTYRLELWIQRQVARGMVLDASLPPRVLEIGDPDEKGAEDSKRGRSAALDKVVEDAKEAAGSNVKSKQGTAIHYASELIDKGESLDELPPLLRERANAYWKFCRENGIQPTSVEVFGVQDDYKVAGTWDRTGWWRRKHKIVDVKTGSSMDFAGITYAVQLAVYAHMCAYDHATGTRTPHEIMDLEEAIIIHIDRNEGGPIALYRVDITAGWRWATLVDEIKAARNEGQRSIKRVKDPDPIAFAIDNCVTLEQLRLVFAQSGPHWTAGHRALASTVAAEIRGMS